jgi:hypothetical protein
LPAHLAARSVDSAVISALLPERLPALAAHLAGPLGFPDLASLFLPRWILCLFLNCFPSEITARIWDSVFLDALEAAGGGGGGGGGGGSEAHAGGARVLLEASLALLSITQRALLEARSFADAVEILKDVSGLVSDASELMLLSRRACASLRGEPLNAARARLAPALFAAAIASGECEADARPKARTAAAAAAAAQSPQAFHAPLPAAAGPLAAASPLSPLRRAPTPVDIDAALPPALGALPLSPLAAPSPRARGADAPLSPSALAASPAPASAAKRGPLSPRGGDELRRRALRGAAAARDAMSPNAAAQSPLGASLAHSNKRVAAPRAVPAKHAPFCAAELAAALNPTIAASASRKRMRHEELTRVPAPSACEANDAAKTAATAATATTTSTTSLASSALSSFSASLSASFSVPSIPTASSMRAAAGAARSFVASAIASVAAHATSFSDFDPTATDDARDDSPVLDESASDARAKRARRHAERNDPDEDEGAATSVAIKGGARMRPSIQLQLFSPPRLGGRL